MRFTRKDPQTGIRLADWWFVIDDDHRYAGASRREGNHWVARVVVTRPARATRLDEDGIAIGPAVEFRHQVVIPLVGWWRTRAAAAHGILQARLATTPEEV